MCTCMLIVDNHFQTEMFVNIKNVTFGVACRLDHTCMSTTHGQSIAETNTPTFKQQLSHCEDQCRAC